METLHNRQLKFHKGNFLIFYFLIFTFCFTASVSAQDEYPRNAAAPPLKTLMKDEKERLESQKDIKKRLELALQLMEVRLKNAETLGAEENYPDMFVEMGFFHAIMDNTLNFLERNNIGRGKILNSYKRFEINLRSFIGRIEIIRRELPPRYEYYVRTLVKAVRDARSRAVAPLFDDSVVPNQS